MIDTQVHSACLYVYVWQTKITLPLICRCQVHGTVKCVVLHCIMPCVTLITFLVLFPWFADVKFMGQLNVLSCIVLCLVLP